MIFSSVIFLFCFLPLTLLLYALAGKRLRNALLLVASLLFYAWGETTYVFLMLASIAANYLVGLGVDRHRGRPSCRWILAAGIVFNLALLCLFKYAGFAIDNLNDVLLAAGLSPFHNPGLHLPIGISFFTFQAMSHIIDVYRRDAKVQRSLINIGLYISLFPQLIAGPIVRYHDIAHQILERSTRFKDFAYGVERFIIGLGKKVLVANQVAIVADQVFDLPVDSLPMSVAWLGSICFVLQVYFDFSGYSDMAIGLGRMFGFRFLENFNYPYISRSITEFWQRWHISLSTWFRDYLYYPLGGNRRGKARTYFNLIIIFFLCGLWHGARWNYVIWGLSHGLFMVLERLWLGKKLNRLWPPLAVIYMMFVFTTTLTIFRTNSIPHAIDYLTVMFGFGPEVASGAAAWIHVGTDIRAAIIAGIIFSFPVFSPLAKLISSPMIRSHRRVSIALVEGGRWVKTAALGGILYVAILVLSSRAYEPFIYFRF